MTYKEYKEKVFEYAKGKNINDCELSYNESDEFSISMVKRKIDKYSDANSFSMSLKVISNGKVGKAYTESFDGPEKLVEEAISNLKIIESEDENFLYDGKGEYPTYDNYNEDLHKLPVKDRIKILEDIYDSASEDKRIKMVTNALYEYFSVKKIISNTKGLDVESKSNGAFSYAMVLAEDVSPRSGFYYEVYKKPEDINAKRLGKLTAEDALEKIGSKSVKSNKYNVIIKNTAFSSILGLLHHMISLENAQKNTSPLKDKVNKKVGSDLVNLKTTPFYNGSILNTNFDDEGVPVKETVLFENGIFKSFINDLKTSKKDGVEPTGNSSSGGISPFNMVFESGEITYDELIKELNNGVIIKDVQGMHSGANPISGDFSLGASGLLVENGKVVRAVDQITISGNFFTMLEKLSKVSNDVNISYDGTITPSVFVENMDIAGL